MEYIQPTIEVVKADMQLLETISNSDTTITDPGQFDARMQSHFFEEEEEDYEDIPLFTVKHKSLWE